MKIKKIFILLVFVILISLLSWCSYLYTKDKDDIRININYINFYIKNKLLKVLPSSQVNIQNTTLVWQKSDEKLYLLFEGIAINDQDVTIKVPQVFLFSKAGLAFLFNSSNIALISVINPSISLNEKPNKQKKDYSITQARALFTNMPLWTQIKVSDLIIKRKSIGQLDISELVIDKQKERNFDAINMIINNGSKNDMLVNLHAFENHDRSMILSAKFSHLDIGLLVGNVFPELSGNFLVEIDKKNKVTDGQLNITKAQGKIKLYSDMERFNLNSANLDLKYSNGIVDIQSLNVQIDQINLLIGGKIDVNTKAQQASLKVQIDQVPAKGLCYYFPASTNFKHWYCNNVIGGNISDIIVELEAVIPKLEEGLSLSSVNLKANIKDIATKFHEDFEPISNLNGNISIQNNSLKIIAEKAQFQNFTINNGSVEAHNLGEANLKLDIKGNADSDAYALFELFGIKETAKIDKEHVLGEAKSEFNFSINEVNEQIEFTADLKSKIDNLSVSNDLYNLFIAGYNLDLNFNNNFDIDFKSHGLMHDKQMQLNVNGNCHKDKKLNYEFIGNISPKDIKKLAELMEIDGYANFHLKSRYDNNLIIEGDVNLSELELDIGDLGWKNKLEDHNSISFVAEIKDKNDILLKNVHAYGEDLDIELSGEINDGLYLNFSKLKLLNNDLKLQMQSNNNQNTINISGESVDLSYLSSSFKGGNMLHSTKVTMNVDKLIMKNNIVISDVYLDFNHIDGNYYGSKFTGILPDGSDIIAEYSQIGLELYADNAGLFLRALNVANTVKDGKLSFYLSSVAEDKTAYGMASFSDLYIVRAPILAKILALSSLQGVVNTLNNDGIYFYEFDIPFSYDNGIVNIEESWLEGAELGISAVGKANIADQTFNIKGQIIPAYALNKSIWKIPLLGKLLTGGKSRGVVAVDYQVKGNEHKNNVSVNLISVLTPNLLKRALEVFNHRAQK